MPLIRRWKRLSLVWQLAIALALAIVIIGGEAIALVTSNAANSTATGAANDAKGAVDCVNSTLGDRNKPSAKDAAAHIALAAADIQFAIAGKAYDSALVTALAQPQGGPGQLAAYKAFVLAAQEKQTADVAYLKQLRAYVKQLHADQRYRAKHPLGQC